MLQPVDVLRHAWRRRSAEMERKQLDLRRGVALFYLDEFKRDWLCALAQQLELRVQMFGKIPALRLSSEVGMKPTAYATVSIAVNRSIDI